MQRPRPIPPAAAMRQQVRATGHRTTEEPGTQPTGQNSPVLQKAQPTGQRPSPENKTLEDERLTESVPHEAEENLSDRHICLMLQFWSVSALSRL